MWLRELWLMGSKGGAKSWQTELLSTLTGFISTVALRLATRIVNRMLTVSAVVKHYESAFAFTLIA